MCWMVFKGFQYGALYMTFDDSKLDTPECCKNFGGNPEDNRNVVEGNIHVTRDATNRASGVSDHVRNKSACAVTEKGWKLEISNLRRKGSELSV